MEWLKKLLEGAEIKEGKLDVDSVVATINKEFPKHAVPKATFNSTNEELKTANNTIKELKENSTSNEELQKTIQKYEDDTKALKAAHVKELSDMKINNAITDILTKNKAIHIDLLKSQFNRENIKVNDDGTISGIEEQFNTIKETYKDQFKAEETGNDGDSNSNYKYVPKSGESTGGTGATSFLDIIMENQARK